MSGGEVVNFPGTPPPSSEADPGVVHRLRELLALAESGKVLGFAIALVQPNGVVTTEWFGAGVHRHAIAAGAAYLLNRISAPTKAE